VRDAFGARPGCDAGGPCAGGRAAWSICSVIERFRRDALISELIEVAHDGSVATVVLNRPEKLNSPTKPMWRLLVAQIHGICVGGGLVIAALCDLRICGTSSRFGAPIENLGLVMAYPEIAPLVRLAGPDVALEILLEGRIFDAGEANQANGERIADVLGHPEWCVDPRFGTNAARMANVETLAALMNAVLATRTKAEWITAFDAAGVPVGPVHTIGEALTHPQTLARDMVVDLVHPQAGPTKALGCPVHFSATPTSITRPAPLLGEHTREVLRECGYADADIDGFVAAGVVEAPGSAR